MLPTAQILIWQQLLDILCDLPVEAPADLQACLARATALFESDLLSQNLDDLPEPIAGKMRSYLTESHRLLRLLSMDAMFLATARSPTIRQQRLQAYQEHLNLLQQFCQAAIGN
jgi:hypothetical protein